MAAIRPFHEPVPIRIGSQSRNLMLTLDAWRRAERALGKDPRIAVGEGGMNAILIMAAVALHHEEKNTSDKTVQGWITYEPKTYPALVEAVGEATRRFLVVTGVLEEEPVPGEAPAPTVDPSTSSAP